MGKLAANLKVSTVVLHSFAHLFAELSAPEVAVDVLKKLEERLRGRSEEHTSELQSR